MHRARVTAQLICPPLVWPVAQPSTMIVLPNVSATASVHAGPRANLQSEPGKKDRICFWRTAIRCAARYPRAVTGCRCGR